MECKLYRAIDKKKEFEGVLKDYSKETVTLEIDGEDREFNRKDISMIRLAIDF